MRRILALPLVPIAALLAVVPVRKSWFYQRGRPTRLGRIVNRGWAWIAGAGLTPESWPGEPRSGTVALETKGRRTGAARTRVVTWVQHEGERYLVSMLGEASDWVRNTRADGGRAVVVRGGRQPVRLVDVPTDQRAPVLQAYLQRTESATAYHLGAKADAPLEELQRIAPRHPVFRIVETP